MRRGEELELAEGGGGEEEDVSLHFRVRVDFGWIRLLLLLIRWLTNIFIKVLHGRFAKRFARRLPEQRRSTQQFQLIRTLTPFASAMSRPDLHQGHGGLTIQYGMMHAYSQNEATGDKIQLS